MKDTEVYKEFGRKLFRMRSAANLTQQQVADALGIGKSTYTQYENGDRGVNLSMLKKIREFFQADMNELLGIGEREIDRSRPFAKWEETFSSVEFTEDEVSKLIDYAMFLVSQREK
ncbi:helix-turn-helix domain-containing protein [Raoultibacter timonensis]|uniref:helix-turn-helix domain-containing protein n=1 Tax=Raoultibacter timonensis TaxID=1907662 RepID=UPI0026DC74E7|nr:helix-turn-helix transcriptional regulator [Raoultibacter timonensis]